MRHILILTLGLTLTASAAWGETGKGAYVPAQHEVLSAARVRPLAELGEDVIRFSSSPQLGGHGWIVELHKARGGWALGEALLFGGHPRTGWTRTGWLRLAAPEAVFIALAQRVDSALAGGEPQAAADDEIIICADGPGYVAERRKGKAGVWMKGFCGAHPNDAIAALMRDAIARFGPLPAAD